MLDKRERKRICWGPHSDTKIEESLGPKSICIIKMKRKIKLLKSKMELIEVNTHI